MGLADGIAWEAENGEAKAKTGGKKPDESPQFTHDCDKDVFLGRFKCASPVWDKKYDLYYADHGGLPDCLMARYGNEGSEYISGEPCNTDAIRLCDPIREAHRRAVAMGLIKPDAKAGKRCESGESVRMRYADTTDAWREVVIPYMHEECSISESDVALLKLAGYTEIVLKPRPKGEETRESWESLHARLASTEDALKRERTCHEAELGYRAEEIERLRSDAASEKRWANQYFAEAEKLKAENERLTKQRDSFSNQLGRTNGQNIALLLEKQELQQKVSELSDRMWKALEALGVYVERSTVATCGNAGGVTSVGAGGSCGPCGPITGGNGNSIHPIKGL